MPGITPGIGFSNLTHPIKGCDIVRDPSLLCLLLVLRYLISLLCRSILCVSHGAYIYEYIVGRWLRGDGRIHFESQALIKNYVRKLKKYL